ncbi:glycosyltransferase [Georgenia sp. SUBG003]|uniref:glycosyltransferase n=1 Tax=Georgenia sp. SUBG003 TaxID=1497974 RepID=UPI003AB505DB
MAASKRPDFGKWSKTAALNVVFVGQQPFDRMAAVLALGDIQLVSLQDLPLFRTTLPSKLQATLAAGRPVLGAVTGDAAEVIRGSAAGVVVTPGSAVEMAEAIVNLSNLAPIERQSLGAAGRAHYLERYSEEVAADPSAWSALPTDESRPMEVPALSLLGMPRLPRRSRCAPGGSERIQRATVPTGDAAIRAVSFVTLRSGP